MDAQRRIGDAYNKLGNEKEALKAWASAADEFDRRKLKPDAQPLAADAAAYSRFQLAEEELRKFDKLKIGGRGKALERSFVAKRAGVKAVNEAYGPGATRTSAWSGRSRPCTGAATPWSASPPPSSRRPFPRR